VFEDIIAMVALYRPGPMQFIDSFIKRKHGQEEINYLHPKMENALSSTYGILVYQEQFMQISKDLAGFTGGQADTLRKAVGKKIMEMMRKVKPEFIDGAIRHSNADRRDMEKFWAQLEEFANYCFNKSHAACYGLIAYWTAYLKAHYPDAFMAALMTSDQDDIDRLAIEITECRHMGITVQAPDVNQSYMEFAVVPGESTIRFGMAAVKGVGSGAVEEVLRAREDGEFKSIEDFAKRVSTSKFNKKAWESLIKSGGFDSFGDRSDLLFNLESIQGFASKVQKDALSGQTDLFGGLIDNASIQPTVTLQAAPMKHTTREQLMWERELLGLYISAHPLDSYDAYFQEQTIPLLLLKPEIDNKKVTVGGIITSVRSIITKSGSKMAFVAIEDKTGESEIIVFPDLYSQVGAKLTQDAVVRVSGKANAKDRDGNLISDVKVIADEVNIVTDKELMEYESTGRAMKAPKARPGGPVTVKKNVALTATPTVSYKPDVPVLRKLFVHIKDPEDAERLMRLKDVCAKHPGTSDIVLVLGAEKKSAIKLPFRVEDNQSLIDELVRQLGEDCVVVK